MSISAESLENNQRIAVFGRSQWDLRGAISKILGGELRPTCNTKDRSSYVCKKKRSPHQLERGLSKDVSVAPSFEAARNVKTPMKSIKTLFPSNARENPLKVSSSRSNHWISNSQAFCSSCGAHISQLCKHLAS